MFSGIIEATAPVNQVLNGSGCVTIEVHKPSFFNDLAVGDSVAVNGVCLTVESFTDNCMNFTLAAETLHITGWNSQTLQKALVNLERAMKLEQRVHGHFVLGHVDGLARIQDIKKIGDSLIFCIALPTIYKPYVWKKGSLTLNGVSLTVNEVTHQEVIGHDFKGCLVEVCLIPETIRSTNMANLNTGDLITFEVDSMARAFVHLWQMEKTDAKI